MGKVRRPDAAEKAAIVADHKAGMTFRDVAAKWGVSKASVHRYVDADRFPNRRPAKSDRRDAEVGLTGGRWVLCPRTRVQRWVPYTDQEVRDAHARYFNGCRERLTVDGERTYQRRIKQKQAASKRAAP